LFESDVFYCEISLIWLPILLGMVSSHKTGVEGNKTNMLLQLYYCISVPKSIKIGSGSTKL